MKKRLLLMALAMLSVVGSYAYEPVEYESEYIYTATGRVKVMGENLLPNGDFSEGFTGWVSGQSDPTVNQTVWKLTDGAGPAGESVVESLGATADEALCMKFADLEGGASYVVSFQINVPEALTTTVGTTIGNNYANFFLNTDGSFVQVAGTEEAPVTGVATAVNVTAAGEWTTVAYDFQPEEGDILIIHFEKMLTGTQIANVSLKKVTKVSDDRVMLRLVDWAEKILADDNFKSDDPDAAESKQTILEDIAEYYVPELYDGGELEAIDAIGTALEALNNDLAEYMDYSSTNLLLDEKFFKYGTDLTTIPKYNRKSITANMTVGGFMFRKDGAATGSETNWQHGQGSDFLNYAIQGTYDSNTAASVALYNVNLPAGKYFISAEVLNAYMDKNYNLTYTLEKGVKFFVGKDSAELQMISGDEFKKFYFVGEIKEGETLEAGVWWEGCTTGSSFRVKGFEIRSFGNAAEEAERKEIFTKYMEQVNAVKSARAKIVEMQTDVKYPWAKDSLQASLTQWDPYYNAMLESGWFTEDGKDTRKADNEELEAWTKYHGVELYDGEGNRKEYQLSRGYQNAATYVQTTNKVFADLAAEIVVAKAVRDDDMNALGDKATFQAAIDAAQNLYDTKLTSTTDATMQADSLELATGIETLKAAEETFKASVPEMIPIVDIDFSMGIDSIMTVQIEGEDPIKTGFVIKGKAGQMEFPLAAFTQNSDGTFATDATTFALGCLSGEEVINSDVLRVGKGGNGTVNLAEQDIPTDNDVLRTTFDLWVGGLINRSLTIELQNAAGERVAGFNYCLYGGTTAYNDFYDEGKELGLNIVACGKSTGKTGDAALLADAYKFSFDIIIDYKGQFMQASLLTSPNKGTVYGDRVVIPAIESGDNKVAKFVLSSNYDNAGRRSWFDNLQMLKYPSTATGPDPVATSIESIAPVQKADNAIYTLTGVKVSASKNNLQPGLYIINGKKYVVK